MIQKHSDKLNRRQIQVKAVYNTMYCLCQFASSDMITMGKSPNNFSINGCQFSSVLTSFFLYFAATHLIKCGKKTCYPSKRHVGMGVLGQSATFPPLVVLDEEDDPSDSSNNQPIQEAHPSASLATGLSLSTLLAANNRSDSSTKTDDENKGKNGSYYFNVFQC